jgi:hypothetical protein
MQRNLRFYVFLSKRLLGLSLLFACARKNIAIIKECINHCTDLDLMALNIYGANFLHWLFHGMEVTDEIKQHLTNSVMKLIDKKIEKKFLKKCYMRKMRLTIVHYYGLSVIEIFFANFWSGL